MVARRLGRTSRSWNHSSRQGQRRSKATLHSGVGPSKRTSSLAVGAYLRRYGPEGHPNVLNRQLAKDREALLAFFDFPAEHWDHLRTSNPIESVFATVRHRTVRTKGALSAKTAKFMVFKLVNAAAKTWRRLKGENQLPKVVQGVKFKNGVEVTEMPAHHAA